MKRRLLTEEGDRELGAVSDRPPMFQKGAIGVFSDKSAASARKLLKEGWSNGYLYLGSVEED